MANNNIFRGLKEVIYAMYDNKGVERITYYAPLSKINLSEARLTLLRNFCDLVLNTDMLSEWSKMYIKDKNITLKSLTEEINRINEEKKALVKVKSGNDVVYEIGGEVSQNTVRSKIEYEQKKLSIALGGKDMIVDILYYPSRSIEDYQVRVANLIAEHRGGTDLRNKLCISLDKKVYSKKFDGDFMSKYQDIIYTYLESTRKAIEEELNKDTDFVGYFNYLLSGIHTDDAKVMEDRRQLIDLINGSVIADIKKPSIVEKASEAETNIDTEEVLNVSKVEEVEGVVKVDKTETKKEIKIEVPNKNPNNNLDNLETSEKNSPTDTESLAEKFSLVKDIESINTNPLDDDIFIPDEDDDDEIDLEVKDDEKGKLGLIDTLVEEGKRLDTATKEQKVNTEPIKPYTPKSTRLQF